MAFSKYENWDQVKLTDFAKTPVETSLDTLFDLNSLALRKIFDGELHLMILSDEDLEAIKKLLAPRTS